VGVDGEYRELVVVDATTTVAGGYCAKLLGQAGAEVVHLEPPGGDPLRRWRVGGEVEPGTEVVGSEPDDRDGETRGTKGPIVHGPMLGGPHAGPSGLNDPPG